MEFYHLGSHCNEEFCKKLDFLPFSCDSCTKVFCAEHFRYENHGCQEHYKKDFKVPVCPVCSQPVAFERGVSFDITVNRHIESNCRNINQKPIYTNACFFQQCKKKELIPFKCSTCSKNFCLKHRHADIHKCKENSNNQRTLAAQAAISRQQNSRSANQEDLKNRIQAGMSEDEALARALQASMVQNDTTQPTSNIKKCAIS
ncbi:unnamed protein product [Diamesa tonsa]